MTDVTHSFKEDLEKLCSQYRIKNLFILKYHSCGDTKQTYIYYDKELVYCINNVYIHNVDTLLEAVIGGMAFAIHKNRNDWSIS